MVLENPFVTSKTLGIQPGNWDKEELPPKWENKTTMRIDAEMRVTIVAGLAHRILRDNVHPNVILLYKNIENTL